MKLTNLLFNTKELTYSSNLSKANLVDKIKSVLQNKSLDFEGRLRPNNEFETYNKLNVIGWNMPNLKRKSAYLIGKISESKNGTKVNLLVKPNVMLPIFGILALLCGVLLVALYTADFTTDTYLFVLGLTLVLLGAIYYPLSTFFRNRLLNRIIKNFDLK